eukprot:Amastigsp_a508395_1463.p3 type:complete len:185 gc:universal Amastigsp_a508395_1463:593-1147(+)
MSFWKHEPPKPTEALRNLAPTRESSPTARATCWTSAPVASQMAEIELMLEMRCARNALAVSLESSDDHTFENMMRSRGTHSPYSDASSSAAAWPAGESSQPMRTRSGEVRSLMAVPSARNSGLERIWKLSPFLLTLVIFLMLSAARTGTVDFSTMIVSCVATSAILRVTASTYLRSAATPEPTP